MSEENRHDTPDPSRACEGPPHTSPDADERETLPMIPPQTSLQTSSQTSSESEGREAEESRVLPNALSKIPSEAEGSEAEGSQPKGESEGSLPKDEVSREAAMEGERGESVGSAEIESPWSKDCRVKLEIFEGPLDLLLFLIRREEIDIYDIPITQITDQYMEYLDIMRMLDLDIASDFLVMAATLIHIKSRMLLPPEERGEEEEEEYDPRMDLVRQLLEYKKFKDAALTLQEMEIEQEKLFPRAGINEPPKVEPTSLDASIFDLLSAFGAVLKRSDAAHLREIVDDRFTVANRIIHITNMLRDVASITFDSLFKDMASRSEIVVTFLALLELVRTKKVMVQQGKSFGAIHIIAQAA